MSRIRLCLLILRLLRNGLRSWEKLRVVLLSYFDPLPHMSKDIFS